jgi:hypothetical protein
MKRNISFFAGLLVAIKTGWLSEGCSIRLIKHSSFCPRCKRGTVKGRKANPAVNALQKPLKDAFSLLFCLFTLPAHSPVLVPQTNIVF